MKKIFRFLANLILFAILSLIVQIVYLRLFVATEIILIQVIACCCAALTVMLLGIVLFERVLKN
ncbi:MAG: hypothetical protein NTX00_03105 [Candidatus Parcubacteria bacterium]|nr:hypothetical protein [Candidatus Parcubacteria bacterium]